MTNWINKISSATSLDDLETIRIAAIGKKGEITAQFAKLRQLLANEKPKIAKELNALKESVISALMSKKAALQDINLITNMKAEGIDVTRFSPKRECGALHPVMEVMDEIIDFFSKRNFFIQTGPMVEEEFYNFQALNLPKHHPARDMQDTFYFKDSKLLRTHTSPVQVRVMEKIKPPFRMIVPGTVFRRDFDVTHTPMFHQVEGLVVDEFSSVTFANLKSILKEFLTFMFKDVTVRFRPSFFPFTEPSAEVDISCVFCKKKGCRICSNTGWLEVLGCGMVDNNVFKAVKYENVSGYAFGLGVERFAMLLYGISDLRSLFESDLRLLGQFS